MGDDDNHSAGDQLPDVGQVVSKAEVSFDLPGAVKSETPMAQIQYSSKSSKSLGVHTEISISKWPSKYSQGSQLIQYLKCHTFKQQTTRIPAHAKDRLKKVFHDIDQDCSGFISRDELRYALESSMVLPSKVFNRILDEALERVDRDKDGVLDYEEFIELCLEEDETFLQRHRTTFHIVGFIAFFFLSPLIYCNFEEDDWSFSDALYFAAVTLTTIGYGDLHPKNDAMRLFTIFYILIGLTLVWQILESNVARFVQFYEKKADAISEKVWHAADTTFSIVAPVVRNSAMMKAAEPATPHSVGPVARGGPTAATISSNSTWNYIAWKLTPSSVTISLAGKGFWLILLTLAPVTVGTLFISLNEGWPWFHGFYWSVVTCTTVGYGDLALEKESSRIFATVFALTGFACAGVVIGKLATLKLEIAKTQQQERILARSLSMSMLSDMSRDGQTVDRCSFVCAMLVQMEKVSEEDLVPLLQKFEELDLDGDGELTYADLKILQRQRRQEYKHNLEKRTESNLNQGEAEDVRLVNAGQTIS